MNELAAHDLRLHYGDRAVIDGLNLTLPGSAVTAIVGPNACGKSTLLRGLTRLLRLPVASSPWTVPISTACPPAHWH